MLYPCYFISLFLSVAVSCRTGSLDLRRFDRSSSIIIRSRAPIVFSAPDDRDRDNEDDDVHYNDSGTSSRGALRTAAERVEEINKRTKIKTHTRQTAASVCARQQQQQQHYITRCNWHDNAIGIISAFTPFDIVNYMISDLTWRFYSLGLSEFLFFLFFILLLSARPRLSRGFFSQWTRAVRARRML